MPEGFLDRLHHQWQAAANRSALSGEIDFLHANFLSRGLTRASGVCRVNIIDGSGLPAGYGTGFMVSPDLMITNHHLSFISRAYPSSLNL
jgi:hypothetical protein